MASSEKPKRTARPSISPQVRHVEEFLDNIGKPQWRTEASRQQQLLDFIATLPITADQEIRLKELALSPRFDEQLPSPPVQRPLVMDCELDLMQKLNECWEQYRNIRVALDHPGTGSKLYEDERVVDFRRAIHEARRIVVIGVAAREIPELFPEDD